MSLHESGPEPTALRNARRDLDAGRPWLARDRLTTYLSAHLDERVLDALGDVYATMGDLPAAGAVWFALDRDDDLARRAAAAFVEYYGQSPERTWNALPRAVRMHSRAPQVAELRIDFARATEPPPDTRFADAVLGTTIFAGCAGALSAAAVGVVTIIRWIFGLE